jgi:hypothetical protein
LVDAENMVGIFRTVLKPEYAQDAQKGCPARPQGAKRRGGRTLRYVEPLSDARTPLADFFSILLEEINQSGCTHVKMFKLCARYEGWMWAIEASLFAQIY